MSLKSSIVTAIAILAPLAACGTSDDTRFTFHLGDAARNCTGDGDCVVLQPISSCSTCCGHGAVAGGEAERAREAVLAACREPDAPVSQGCAMDCGMLRPACFEGTCVALPEKDGSGVPPETPGCPTVPDAGSREPVATDSGAGPSCGARPIQTGFEEGLDPAWRPTDPSAFRIDTDTPLSGSSSLRITYRQKAAYLTIDQPDACAVRIAFTLRTRLLTSGITLARIVTGSGSWFHLRLDHCNLSITEEAHSGQGVSIGSGGSSSPIPEDTPIRLVITIDLRTRTTSTLVTLAGKTLLAPKTAPVRGDATAIRAIELGPAPGIESAGVGTVWIDDLTID